MTEQPATGGETPQVLPIPATSSLPPSTDPGATMPLDAPAPTSPAPLLGGVGDLPFDPAPSPPTPPTAVDPQEPWASSPAPQGPRIRTVLWGLVALIVAVTTLASASGRTVDYGLVAIGILGLAGTTLVVASIFSAARRSRRR